jgi:hypothetical protein
MRIALLVEGKMHDIPDDVKVIANYGDVSIPAAQGGKQHGDHMIVDGEPEAIKRWLRPYAEVWVGQGQPAEERFEVMHIKHDLVSV